MIITFQNIHKGYKEYLHMIERLYQPDFSSIFRKTHANAFFYGQIDTLIWPIFTDVDKSPQLKKLLKLKNENNREYFYHRKISIEDAKVELNCSNLNIALIQAMDIGRSYGISNSDVIAVVKKDPKIFKGVISYNPSIEADFSAGLRGCEQEISVAGIALYPSYTKLDLTNDKNTVLKELISHCRKKNYFIKIDVGNLYLPKINPEYTTYDKIKAFLSMYPNNIFILSGLDISGDIHLYYQLMKYYNNLWIEIDPRSFGGMTPKDCFNQLFNIKGFIQNCWHRLLIGSATPTLEAPQVMRGFLEATEELPFAQRCLLRTWAFRNVNRINRDIFQPILGDRSEQNTILSITEEEKIENNNELNLVYKIKLGSYSVTQLLYITKLIKQVFDTTLKKYPNLKNGELFIRSYHTTTSLIVNEHEFGNYLDLHYQFAEISKKDSSQFLHTVKALENRADFNHYDHELASTYGNRELTLPILNRKLEIGGRENFYLLVTFGPRTVQLLIKVKLLK